jgi:hypothetical protein
MLMHVDHGEVRLERISAGVSKSAKVGRLARALLDA